MRITNSMMVSQLMYNLEKNLNIMSRKQDELASGKRVLKASDDPIDASKILKLKSDISEYKQFGDNATDAKGWLEVTESAISDTNSVMLRMKELAVQAQTGVYSVDETRQISEEVAQLKKQVVTNGNLNFAGRYVFSGFQTNEPFFKDDGTLNIDITNNEMTNTPRTKFQIGAGEDLEISTNGIDVFGTVATTTAYDSIMTDSTSTNGVIARKSMLSGAFDLGHDYTGEVLDIDFGGTVYNVNESVLDGSSIALDKSNIITELQNANNGANLLSDVADIYFDADDNLIIKAKTNGNTAISVVGPSPSFTPTLSLGNSVVEASIDYSGQTFDDAFVAANSADLVSTPIYLTYNGERKEVKLDSTLVLNTTSDLRNAIQNATDASFGTGNISVTLGGGAPNEFLEFSTVGTTSNLAPSLGVELIVSKESELIRDIDSFITALTTNDKAGIGSFVNSLPTHMNRILESQAEIGAKVNRIDLVLERLSDNTVSFTSMLSDAQDADMGETIMKLKNAENVYKSALSTGARVIQPTLIDFIR